MKKTLQVILLIYTLAIASGLPKAAAQLPFYDGFESGNFITGGWAVSGGALVSTQSPSQGLYCAQGPATWGLLKSIPSITDSVLFVEFDVKASQTNTTCLIFRIRDNNFGTSAGFFLNNLGQIMGVNGPTPAIALMNYNVNQWYKILFELHMNTHTYDIYIDGVLVANDFGFYSPGFGVPVDFSWSSVATSGSAWIDAVNIYGSVAAGMNETSRYQENIIVFPNPAAEKLNVKMNYNGRYDAVIYNTYGEKVFCKSLSKTDNAITLGNLAEGIYLLNIVDETGRTVHSERILKQ